MRGGWERVIEKGGDGEVGIVWGVVGRGRGGGQGGRSRWGET